MTDEPVRCPWSLGVNDAYIDYHDTEWGVPVRDDRTRRAPAPGRDDAGVLAPLDGRHPGPHHGAPVGGEHCSLAI